MDLLPMILALAAAGVAGGVLAGLLGVGGGIVIVPALDAVLAAQGVDVSVRLHISVATSLAIIIPTSIASARAHHNKSAVNAAVIRYWAPFIIAGVVLGSYISTRVSGETLAMIFAVVAIAAALKLILPLDDRKFADDIPRGIFGGLIPVAIGAVSTLMGIGGGSLSVPAMTLCGRPVHVAVGTSAVIGGVIAIPGAMGYVITGWGNPLLPPFSAGYVSLLGFAIIVPMTIAFAPLGARLAHAVSRRTLSALFGAFLLIVGVRMAFVAMGF